MRSPLSSVTPALSIATSVPVPMAMPTSAAASAGASLTPSPAMATTRPSRRNRSTTALFCSGSTSASTSAMPSRRATAMAVVRLSPVSMTMRMPLRGERLQRLRRARLDRVGDGDDARRACRRSPRRSTVAPSWRSRSASASSGAVGMPSSARKRALPSTTRLRSTMPIAPLPVGASKPRTGARAMRALGGGLHDRQRERMLARALDARRRTSAPSSRRTPRPRRWRRPSACPRSACRSCRPPACRPSPCARAPRRS